MSVSRPIYYVVGFLLALALIVWLVWLFTGLTAPVPFGVTLALGAGLLWLGWRALQGEGPPRWLAWLLVGATLLRLALGVFWLLALPEWGYDTAVQDAGYVMEDAYNRDVAAWELAQSDLALGEAFRGYSASDQYGGLLFLSAGVYRYLGGGTHQPLLMLALAAAVSSLAIPFLWAFSRREWGERAARWAAWGLALYPEAVLLGSSQMREAFTMTLAVAALYALLRVRERPSALGYMILLVPIAITVVFSPPSALLVIGLVLLAALGLSEWRWLRSRRIGWVLLVIGLLLAAFVGLGGVSWLVESARWQSYVSANASGWVARTFERVPLWGQVPFLILYGVFRPLLPAAALADGLPIWRVVMVWRALGWMALLLLLIYASYLALRKGEWLKLPGALLLANWGAVLVASYRGGGDDWDNPRYRAAFAGLQVGLAAWAWLQRAESEDPWLRRALGGALLVVAWFVPWYLRRYGTLEWPIVEIQHVVGLGLASAALYAIWDWARA